MLSEREICPCGYTYEKANKELYERYEKDPECEDDVWDVICDHEMGCEVLRQLEEVEHGG